MSELLSLTSKETAYAILGRTLYTIRCCGRLMSQRMVRSHLPKDRAPFGVSEVVLDCGICEREIHLLLMTARPTHEEMEEALETEPGMASTPA